MTLPRSVKVRSTCNACQQAKIRCSHEKPSCRRCQKHNIDCVYSVSRRLGRPAKKRDPDDRRRKPKKEVEETQGIIRYRRRKEETLIVLSDIDFTDSWLQDFITDLPDTGILDTVTENSALDSITTSASLPDPNPHITPYYDPVLLQSSPDNLDMDMALLPMDMDTSTSPAETLPSLPTPVSPPIDTSPNHNHNGNVNLSFRQSQPPPPSAPGPMPRRPYDEYQFPDPLSTSSLPTPLDINTNIDPYTCQCQCHEHTLREIIRVNMTLCAASRIAPAGTIDAILTSQRGLQNLAETIMQCSICAGTRLTLLTVVMVSIDSLISAMEVITASSAGSPGAGTGAVEEVFGRFPSPKGAGGGNASGTSAGGGGGGTFLKSQIEACPLLVGSFRVPQEETYTFVKQVLQTRLGGLLTTIRRIRFCTQEMLSGTAARGRLVMMMETDRRLQMVMMRMRMLGR